MTDRAKECTRCRFWKWHEWTSFDGLSHGCIAIDGCDKGHRPRCYWRYDEVTGSLAGSHKWQHGFRRRCEDFEEVEHGAD